MAHPSDSKLVDTNNGGKEIRKNRSSRSCLNRVVYDTFNVIQLTSKSFLFHSIEQRNNCSKSIAELKQLKANAKSACKSASLHVYP